MLFIASSSLLLMNPSVPDPGSPAAPRTPSSPDAPPSSTSSTSSTSTSPPPLPPHAVKFVYMTLHMVDNLVQRHQTLRTDSNIQALRLSRFSTRLALLSHSNIALTARTIDYDNILCPPRLSLADRMSISLKDQVDRSMNELNSILEEMECLHLSMDDILVSLCHLATSSGAYSGELEGAVKHVQQVYFNLAAEVRGPFPSSLCLETERLARRALWFQFTADEKRKAFMAASTLGEIMLTPPVEWDEFAK